MNTRTRRVVVAGGILAALAIGLVVNYLRPVPAVVAASLLAEQQIVPGTAPALPWPDRGSAAIGVAGGGVFAESDASGARPLWSVAKLMSALVVLDDHPLSPGEDGPAVTVTPADVAAYQSEKAAGQSTVAVTAGEQLTERQLLQGLLVPSGNNYAELLADWDAGSAPAMVARLNKRARSLGLNHTHFADVTGVDASTAATPTDAARLGLIAMANPTIAQIVGLAQTDLPVAGTVYNVDYVLGQDGIVGVKTGSNPDAASANFVFAARRPVTGGIATIVGAVMGEDTLDHVFSAAKALIGAAAGALVVRQVLPADLTAARYTAPWGASAAATTTTSLSLPEWPGEVIRTRVEATAMAAPRPAGEPAGQVAVTYLGNTSTVPLALADPIPAPRRIWRLTRL